MRRTLVLVGGAINVLFVLFHLRLGWQLHHLPVHPGMRALLETFNLGGTVMIAFFALVSLAYPREVLTTGVGRSATAAIILVYSTRALAEVALFPRPSAVVMLVCLAITAVYVAALVLREPAPSGGTAASSGVAGSSRSPGSPGSPGSPRDAAAEPEAPIAPGRGA